MRQCCFYYPPTIVILSIILILLAGPVAAQFSEVTDPDLAGSGNGRAVALGDYNNDPANRIDIFVMAQDYCLLLRNVGLGIYIDRTSSSGLAIPPTFNGAGASWGDYDNDGYLDIYLVGTNPDSANILYRNDGDGTFTDVTDVSGPVGVTGYSYCGAWGDYDNDGYIDLYVTISGGDDFLFHNNGNGTFSDVTDTADILAGGNGRTAIWGDYDNDGDIDLYVGTSDLNRLYRNDGTGSFTELAGDPGYDIECNYDLSTNASWVDFDNDSDLDLFVVNDGDSCRLFRNSGAPSYDFTDHTIASGLGNEDWNKCAVWGDFNSDGFIDLYLGIQYTTGILYIGTGYTFYDATSSYNLSGFEDCFAAASGDFNNDGYEDLYCVSNLYSNKLFENDEDDNHYLQVELEGVTSNAAGIGVQIKTVMQEPVYIAKPDPHWIYEEVTRIRHISGGSGKSQNSMIASFGFGDVGSRLDQLQIIWPSGITRTFTNFSIDRRLSHKEQQGWWDGAGSRGVDIGEENSCAAWGDYDNDGRIDLFVGGSVANYCFLFQNTNGGFVDKTEEAGLDLIDNVYTASWGDIDNDDDLDLFLVGSPERLYRNDGTGSFTNISGSSEIPLISNVRIAMWGDYNNDLDLDLYLVTSGNNILLENDGDNTFSVVDKGVDDSGVGRFAAWGYFNGDDDLDLYVVNNGENRLYTNNGSMAGFTFTDETIVMGAADIGNGMTAAVGDYDYDGDQDIYVVNQAGYPNKMLINDGGSGFTAVTDGPLGDGGLGKDASWIDCDNDGDLDLYLVESSQENKLFRNEGGGVFVDDRRDPVPLETGDWNSAAWGDYDNDGDLDVYVSNWAIGSGNALYTNSHTSYQNPNHWLQVELRTYASAMGCKIRIEVDGNNMYHTASSGSGFSSQNSFPAHFGLGSATTANSVQVTWTDGTWTTLYDVPADKKIIVYQNEPACSVDRTSIDFGLVDYNSEHLESFRITNDGLYPLQGDVELADGCSDYFSITGGEGHYSLGPSEFVDVEVRFAPSNTGHYDCQVELGSEFCSGVQLEGDCADRPICSVTPLGHSSGSYFDWGSGITHYWSYYCLSYGQTIVGSYIDSTFTITNIGGSTLSGNVVQSSGSCAPFAFLSGGNVDFHLGNGESHNVTVRFDPASNGGYSCYLDLGTPVSYGENEIRLAGYAGPPPECSVTPTALNFGTLEYGEYEERTFRITNIGYATLIGIINAPCECYSIVSDGDYELYHNEYKDITVRYEPLAAGTHVCLIDPGLDCVMDVNCTGTCLEPPVHLVSADCIFLDTVYVDTTFDTTFMITNTGGGTLSGYISESSSFITILSGYGAYSLGHGEVKTVTARFHPTSSDLGFKTDEIYLGEDLNRMIFTAGHDVRAFDTWDLGNPEPIGYQATLGMVEDIFISGNYAYVTTGSTGMQIYSIADPANFDSVGSIYLWGAEDLFVSGDYAYVCTNDGLKIVNVSDPTVPSLIATFGSPADYSGVFARGDSVYLAEPYSGFKIVDISIPASPIEVGFCSTGPSNDADGVFVSGDYAYVAGGVHSGVKVIDIGAPGPPDWITSVSTLDRTRNVYVEEPYLYVTDDSAGVHIFDVSDPESLGWVARYNTPGVARDIVVSGHAAYIADTEGILLLNVYNPYNPIVYASHNIDPPGYWCLGIRPGSAVMLSGYVDLSPECVITPLAIDFGDINVYTAKDSSFTISNEGGGRLYGNISEPCSLYSITDGGGSYSLLGGESKTINVRFRPMWTGAAPCSIQTESVLCGKVGLDGNGIIPPVALVDPTYFDFDRTLVSTSRQETFTIKNAGGGTLDGNVSESSSEFSIMSGGGPFSIPAGESVAVTLHFSPTTSGLHECFFESGTSLSDRLVLLANTGGGLRIYNAKDPDSLIEVGEYNTAGDARGVCVSGNYAYLADGGLNGETGFIIFDISDPADPDSIGAFHTWGFAYDIFVRGDYAYVANRAEGIKIFDVSDPSNPDSLGHYDTAGASDLVVRGDYAYIADWNNGLTVINVSDPENPYWGGWYNTPGGAISVVLDGNYAYLADWDSGLIVIDISTPTNPTFTGSYDTPGSARGLELAGRYAYVVDGETGLLVFDISIPASPMLVGSCDTPHLASFISLSGVYAYVSDQWDGVGTALHVIDVSDPSNPVLVMSIDSPGDNNPFGIAVKEGGDVLCSGFAGFQYAVIDSINDVPNDQGKQASVSWDASVFDYDGSPVSIIEYSIYRKVDESLLTIEDYEAAAEDSTADSLSQADEREKLSYPPGNWQYLLTMPAYCEYTYSAVLPTLADSTITEGMYYSTFFVRAGTGTPAVYYDSQPDSGYSVDNLAPHVPLGFVMEYNAGSGNDLSWEECTDDDFQYFRIYRGASEEFEPSPDNLIHSTPEIHWLDTTDEGWRYYYKITSVDFSGNESVHAGPTTITGDNTPSTPKVFALYQNIPNPFNPVTTFRFDLPRAVHVKLSVYNVKGQLVFTVLDQRLTAGHKEISWEARDGRGRNIASGVYFFRLIAGNFVQTKKMVLLR